MIDRRLERLARHEQALDEAMQQSLHGETMTQAELLQLQATVYAYSQRVDVATRVVGTAANAVRRLLEIQL